MTTPAEMLADIQTLQAGAGPGVTYYLWGASPISPNMTAFLLANTILAIRDGDASSDRDAQEQAAWAVVDRLGLRSEVAASIERQRELDTAQRELRARRSHRG